MKKTISAILIAMVISIATTIAHADNAPVAIVPKEKSVRTTTVVTGPDSGKTEVKTKDAPKVYDAITGEELDAEKVLETGKKGKESLRDKVRNKNKQ